MDFQRARSEEQRGERRRVILETAATMLTEMPVAAVSLNELSRRVGLAKSNVLRYFESREAVLLELLDAESQAWADELGARLALSDDAAKDRARQLAVDIAETLRARPVLCDLISAQSSVLERNVSTDVVLRHKRATADLAARIVGIVRKRLPEVTDADAMEATAIAMLIAGAAWPHEQPSDALAAAYDADPAVAALHLGFVAIVSRTLTLTLQGLLVGKAPGVRITV